MGEEGIDHFTLNTGAKMPSLGLGTWQSEPSLVGAAVTAAVKAGYRHIDCARAYRNEKEVGLALRELFEEGVVRREDLFITSKLCTWNAMEKLYDSGKARAIGISNFSSKKLEDLLSVARIPPAVDQVECHPCWHQTKLRAFCQSKGIHLSGYSPLGSPGTSWIKGDVLGNPIVTMVADKLGKTPAQVALRWGIQMGHSVLPKSSNITRVKENLDIFGWSIPGDLFAILSEIEQVRLVRGEFFANEYSVYKTVEELWDGEI